jgi:hypothetical protein
MATTPVIEKVQIWFHFLNLAHKSKDPELIALLDANKSKYQKWGNYRTMSWTKWWKNHSHLFSTQKAQVITKEDEFPADTFVISIPFDQSKSQAGNTVKRLYGKALEERGRVGRLSQFKFSINPKTGKEHLVYAEKMRTYLTYARDVYIPTLNSDVEVSRKEFLEKTVSTLEKMKIRNRTLKRGRGKNAVIEQYNKFDNLDMTIQQIERMSIYVENILFNVASGIFPGEYSTKRKKPSLKISRQKEIKVVRVPATPKSTISKYMQKKRYTNDPFDTWSPARRASYEKKKAEKEAAKKL